MSHFVALARWDGDLVYVNPAQIIHVTPATAGPEGPRSVVTFALLRWTDGTDHGPLTETYRGTPADVAALMLVQAGPR